MDVTGNFKKKYGLNGRKSHDYNINARTNLNEHISAGGSLSGNTLHPPTASAFVSAQTNNNSATLSHQNVPGFGTTNTAAVSANLLNNNGHSVNANAFSSRSKLENGFKFNSHGGGVNYSNPTGLSVGAGVSTIPGIQRTTEISASQNILSTPNTSLDFSAGAARTCNTFGQCNTSRSGMFRFQGKF